MKRLQALVFCALTGLVGCQSGQLGPESFPARTPLSKPTSSDALVIGLVGTLTGPDAWRGSDAFEGADLGVHDLNRALSRDDPVYELVSLDDEGDPARATDLVEQLAASRQTVGIIYAGPPEALPPAEQALAEAGIPALLCYGDLYAGHSLTPHVFQVSPSYLWEARRIAGYLIRDRRYKRVGAIVDPSSTGNVALRSLKTALREAGSKLVATVRLTDGDPVAALRALRARKVEAVVVEGSQGQFAGVLRGLRRLGATYRSTDRARIASASSPRKRREHGRAWRPQVAAFDSAMGPAVPADLLVPGLVVADTYARGAHLLPVPSLASFAKAYRAWWESEPLGWERRAYEAVRSIGWAQAHSNERDDLAVSLQRMRGERLGSLDITFGPDDHTSVDATTVGLWVVPSEADYRRFHLVTPDDLPWVPLARGFSIDGTDTEVPSEDWRYLFRNAPRPDAPPPKVLKMRFSVASPRRDPRH
jgi:ABC-type branched-subunit amino acid transport system substrate-binding protein